MSRINPYASIEKRTRRPPRDPTNALLSLDYTLLGEAVSAALEVVGLDLTISKRRDHVRIYSLCATCIGKTWVSGGKEVLRETPAVVV